MEFMQNKPEDKKVENKKEKHSEPEIYVDPNHQLSKDAKWGHELSKNDILWNKYFNNN